jgi:hypothetical protein
MLFATNIPHDTGSVLEILRARDERNAAAGPRPAEYDALFRFLENVGGSDAVRAICLDIVHDTTITEYGQRKLLARFVAARITPVGFHTEIARLRTIGAALREAAKRAAHI